MGDRGNDRCILRVICVKLDNETNHSPVATYLTDEFIDTHKHSLGILPNLDLSPAGDGRRPRPRAGIHGTTRYINRMYRTIAIFMFAMDASEKGTEYFALSATRHSMTRI